MLSCCKRQQNREEVNQRIENRVKGLVGQARAVYYAHIGQKSDNAGRDTAGSQNRDIRRVHVGHHLGEAVQKAGLLIPCCSRIVDGVAGLQTLCLHLRRVHQLRVDVAYVGSDEYLAVAGAYQGSQYAVYRFQGCLVELGLVLQGETKSRCAVDTVVDVVSPADSGDDGLN